MYNFTVKRIKEIKGKQAFYQLVINDQPVIDDFKALLEEKYLAELGSMYFQMQRIADLQKLAKTDFRVRKDLHKVLLKLRLKT